MNDSNPYGLSHSGDPFAGYDELIEKIKGRMRNGQSFLVIGGYRCGKTSFLKKLEGKINTNQENKESSHTWIPRYLDVSGLADSTSDVLFGMILKSITNLLSTPHKEFSSGPVEYQEFLKCLDSLIPKLRIQFQRDWTIVFLFDDLDWIGPEEVDHEFYHNIRHFLSQSDFKSNFRLVATGATQVLRLTLAGSPLQNILNCEYLGVLSKNGAEDLIDIGFPEGLDKELKNTLLKLTGRHPFLLHGLLEELYERKEELNKLNLEELVDEFIHEHDEFQKWIEIFSGVEHAIYQLLINTSEADSMKESEIKEHLQSSCYPPSQIGSALNLLSFHGLIDDVDIDQIHVAGTLFRDWYWDNYLDSKITMSVSEDIVMEENQNVLPLGLKQLIVQNFLCIKSVEIKGIPVNCQWVFLTGDNGDGKTVLLQALAIGLHGTKDAENLLETRKDTKIGVETKITGKSHTRNFYWKSHAWKTVDSSNKSQTPKPLNNVIGYGPIRLEIQGELSRSSEKMEANSPVYSLMYQKGNLRNFEAWLKGQRLEEADAKEELKEKIRTRAKKAQEIILSLMPNVSDIKIKGQEVLYEFNEKGYWVPVEELSSGQKSIFALFGDMIIRLFESQPDVVDPKDLCGIVIIDELGIHLHPKWQIDLPERLSSFFPKVQFIASAHSLLPILGAPERSLFFKVTRDSEEGFTEIEQISIDIANLLPNSLLTSPIFDLNSLVSRQNVNFSEVFTGDKYSDYEAEKEQKKRLKEDQLPPEIEELLKD